MAREIKTRLTLDGEKEFKKQIAAINSELKLNSAQLKEVASAYDLSGDKQTYLAQKSKILKDEWAAQARIVDQYNKRIREAENSQNLSAEGMRRLQTAASNARTKYNQLAKQVEDTDKELEELGRDSRRAGKQLEDNLGDAADEVSGKFSSMVQDIDSSLKSIKGMQGVSLAVDLVKGAWNIGSQAYQWAQGYAEENMKTAMTQYNVETAGGDWAQTSKLAIQYASIFGDKDSALEAINALVSVGYTGESLETIAKYIGGGAIEHRGDLNIESIASDLAKTVTTGNLEGQLADLLKYATAGTTLTEEYIREQLAEARVEDVKEGSNRNVMAAVEAYLRDAGFDKTFENFTDQNQAMIDAAVAAGTLNQELANLANEVNIALTPAFQVLTEAVKWLTEQIKGRDEEKKQREELDRNVNKHVAQKLMQAAVYMGIDEEEARRKAEYFAPHLTEVTKQQAKLLPAIVNTAAGGFNGWTTWTKWLTDYAVKMMFGESNASAEISTPQTETPSQTQEEYRRMQAIWRASNQGVTIEKKPFGEINESIKTETDLAAETATDGGVKIGTSLWSGMQAQTSQLIAIAQQQRALLEAVWNDPITPTVVVSYGTAPGATGGKPNLPTLPESVSVTVELDKRKLGQTIVPLVDQALGGAAGADVDKIY